MRGVRPFWPKELVPIYRSLSTAAPRPPVPSTTSFFPVQSSPDSRSDIPFVPKPPYSHWYTGRPIFDAVLTSLQGSLRITRDYLFRASILRSASSSIGPKSEFYHAIDHSKSRNWRKWKGSEDMAALLGVRNLTVREYRSLIQALDELLDLVPYVEVADSLPSSNSIPYLNTDPITSVKQRMAATSSSSTTSTPDVEQFDLFKDQLIALINVFSIPPKVTREGAEVVHLSLRDRRVGSKDAMGRTQGTGRRKESTASVWIVPSKSALDTENSVPGRVLVNARPISSYFSTPVHRFAAIRPLTYSSTLGLFNVFAVTSGGGIAAQADAVSMGLARALVEWEDCQVDAGKQEEDALGWRKTFLKGKRWTENTTERKNCEIQTADQLLHPSHHLRYISLQTAGLIQRDPRQVERKKPGKDKARKAKAWVKR